MNYVTFLVVALNKISDEVSYEMMIRQVECSAEVHFCESFPVLIDWAPGAVILLLLWLLHWLLGSLVDRFLHWSSHIVRLAGVVSLAGGFAFVSAGHDC